MLPLDQDTQQETSEQYRARIIGNIKKGSIPSHIAKDPKFFEAFKMKMDSLKSVELEASQQVIPEQPEVQQPLDGFTGASVPIEKLPEEKSMLELIADKAINMGAGAIERAGDIGGSLLTTAQTFAEDLDKSLSLGGPVFKEGDILPTWVSSEEFYKDREKKGLKSPLDFVGEKLKDTNLGYEEQKSWEDVKKSFSKGGAFSGSAYADVLEYGVEQGIKSIPDMIAVIGAMPAYLVSRSGEIGEIRAKNKGKEKADSGDILEAAPFAVASALLEKIGVKGMTAGATEVLGKEILKAGVKESAKRIAKEGGKALAKEATTEAVQEGILEYVGEKFGTDAEMTFKEALDRGAGAAVAGGIFGSGVGAVSTAVSEQVQKKKLSTLEKGVEGEIIGGTLPIDDDYKISETDIGKTIKDVRKEGIQKGKTDLPQELIGDVFGEIKKEKVEHIERAEKTEQESFIYDKELNKRLDVIEKLEGEKKFLSDKKNKSKKQVQRQQELNKRIEVEAQNLDNFIKNKGEVVEDATTKLAVKKDVKPQEQIKKISSAVEEKIIPAVKKSAETRNKQFNKLKNKREKDDYVYKKDDPKTLIADTYKNIQSGLRSLQQTMSDAKGLKTERGEQVFQETKKKYHFAKKEANERIALIEADPEFKQILTNYDLNELKKGALNPKTDLDKIETIKTVDEEKTEEVKEMLKDDTFSEKESDYSKIIGDISPQIRFTNEQGQKLTPDQIKSGIRAIKNGKTNKSAEAIIKTLEKGKQEGIDLYQLSDSKGGQRGTFSETKKISAKDFREMLEGIEVKAGTKAKPDVFASKQPKEKGIENKPYKGEYTMPELPEYSDRNYKVRGGKIVTATPDYFNSIVRKKLDLKDEETVENIDDLAQMLEDGREIDPPQIYVDGYQVVNHDGRHRAEAAKKLGYKTIPLLIIDVNNKKIGDNLEFKKEPLKKPQTLSSKMPTVETKKEAPKKPSGKGFDSGFDSPMHNYQKMYRSLGLPERPGTSQVKLGDKRITLKAEDKPTRREGIQAQVEAIIGPRLYLNKIKNKSALGTYYQSNSEVRTADYYDIEVLAHEMAHYLDFHYAYKKKFSDAYKKDSKSLKEVEGLSYTSQPELVALEGFAEYSRLWLTQYEVAKEKAPNFTKRFEAVLKTDKKLNRQMKALQADMHRWFYQGDLARLNAVTSGNQYTAKERATRLLNRRPSALLRQKFIDHIHAAKVITTDTKGMLGDATTDPYKQLQLINGVEGIFEQSVKHGSPTFTEDGNIEFAGASLDDVWSESVKHSVKRLRQQEQYFIARRASELKGQGRENLLTEGMINEGLKLGDKYPQFKKAFSDYQEYRKNMMDFYVESGYLERKVARKMMDRNKNYVPFHRVTEGVIESGKGSGASFQKLKGGTQNIKHVYNNILMQDSKHLQAALKANALRELYSEGLKSQEGSKFFTKINPDAIPVKAMQDQMLEKIGRMFAELGIDEESEFGDDIYEYFDNHPEELMFWSFGNKPKTSETMVDSFIDKKTGKRVWVELNKENKLLPDMLDALDGFKLPKGIAGKALSVAMKVKQFQTLTITAMMQFAGPNIIRDQQQAFFLSGGTYKPLLDPIKGLGEYLKSAFGKKSLFDEMRAQGGPGGGRVRTFLENEWGFAEKQDYKIDKPFYHPSQIAKDLLDVYVGIMDSAEMATRIGFYSRLISQGKSPREAAFQAREISTDFAKHGSYAPFVLLQRTVPFFGAYVQSVDRDLRGMFERNGKIRFGNMLKNPEGKEKYTSLKFRMAMIGQLYISMHIALALMGDDEEAYKALTPDQKARFFHYFIGGKHYTLPKPHGLVTLFGSLAEGITDIVKGQKSETVKKDLLFAISYHLGMDAMPGILNPMAEVALNQTFTGAPIVGRGAERRSEEYQYSDRTPQLYVRLGKSLGVSPDKARHIVKGYTGYVEEIIAENTEKYMWDEDAWGERPNKRSYKDMVSKQFVPKKIPYRTKYTIGYYDLKKRALMVKANFDFAKSQITKTEKIFESILTDKEQVELLSLEKMFKKVDEKLKDTYKQVSLITYDKRLSGEEKIKQIENLYIEKNKLLKDIYFDVSKIITKTEKALKKNKTEK